MVAVLVNPWVTSCSPPASARILLSQSAFKAARLDYSLPPIAAAEPIAGIALGVSLLGDKVSVSVLGLAVESVCLVAMVGGVMLIGRSVSLANCRAGGQPCSRRARRLSLSEPVVASTAVGSYPQCAMQLLHRSSLPRPYFDQSVVSTSSLYVDA